MARIKAIPGYANLFRKEFPGDPDPVTPDNWAKAIGAFERTLVTPPRFDAYLTGDAQALSPEERTGLRKFIDTGCISCHNGVDVRGRSFRKVRVLADYLTTPGRPQPGKSPSVPADH